MDQVRTIAKIVWQQRFWVLSILGTIVVLVCWGLATSDLEARFSKRKSTIGSKFNAVRAITNESFHPNDDVNAGDQLQVEAQKDYVSKLWSDLYEKQRTEVLFWPTGKVLGDEFAQHMEGKRFRDNIVRDMREKYRNYIKEQFKTLIEIVKANKNSKKRSGGRGEMARFGGGSPLEAMGGRASQIDTQKDEDYLVDWLDQDVLRNRLVFSKMPTPVQIWVTQEDLWVYETLLNVIANTNAMRGATRPDNTAIRTIVELQVGRNASQGKLQQETIYLPSEGGQQGGGSFSMGGRMEMGRMGSMDMGRMGSLGSGESYGGRGGSGQDGLSDIEVLANRYLDPDGLPYPGDSEDFGTEYRKLPIRMLLTMDQRMLPEILVECANAALPIEVTRVIVNREKSNAAGFTGRSSNRRQGGGRRGGAGKESIRSNLSEVEIQGIVLIYEPPSDSVLRTSEEESVF